MDNLIKELQEVIDKKADNDDIRKELSTLVKMLKIGFEKKTTGMERIPKIFATNDNDKITKFYDTFANQINALKVNGSFDLFASYLSTNYGIKIDFESESCPNNRYITKPKKLKKFEDIYTGYFLDELPKEPNDAIKKILLSLDKLTKEFNNENEAVKESLKDIIDKQSEHSPLMVKTVDKILTSARLKALKVEDVANDADDKLTLQQQGIDFCIKSTKPE